MEREVLSCSLNYPGNQSFQYLYSRNREEWLAFVCLKPAPFCCMVRPAFKPELLVMASNSAVEIVTKTMSWTDED